MGRCQGIVRAAVQMQNSLENMFKQSPAGGQEAGRVDFPRGGEEAPSRGSSQHKI